MLFQGADIVDVNKQAKPLLFCRYRATCCGRIFNDPDGIRRFLCVRMQYTHKLFS